MKGLIAYVGEKGGVSTRGSQERMYKMRRKLEKKAKAEQWMDLYSTGES